MGYKRRDREIGKDEVRQEGKTMGERKRRFKEKVRELRAEDN